MANLKLKNPAGGSLNFVSADSASDLTVTFPAVTGTAMVSGNMPAFSAYAGSGTSCANGAQTKVLFSTELFDTNNNFASSTFTPTVAGYYQFTAGINFSSGSFIQLTLKRNNVDWQYGSFPNGVSNTNVYVNASFFAYANGTTDYFEIYVYQASGGTITNNTGQAYTFFTGALVRAA